MIFSLAEKFVRFRKNSRTCFQPGIRQGNFSCRDYDILYLRTTKFCPKIFRNVSKKSRLVRSRTKNQNRLIISNPSQTVYFENIFENKVLESS